MIWTNLCIVHAHTGMLTCIHENWTHEMLRSGISWKLHPVKICCYTVIFIFKYRAPFMLGVLSCVLYLTSTSTVTLNLTSLSGEWCVGRWANFSCRATGITTTTSLIWNASNYLPDQLSLSTGHSVGTTRPEYLHLHEPYAILTNKTKTSIESQLHIFVKENTYTTIFCVVNPPGTFENVSLSEGMYIVCVYTIYCL